MSSRYSKLLSHPSPFSLMYRKAIYLLTEQPVNYVSTRALPRLIERRWAHYTRNSSKIINAVVSLTSYPPRFRTLTPVLKSLLMQSLRPENLILYISQADRELLPEAVVTLQNDGLTIRYCDDTRQYKKIIYALEEHPELTIVTADDDTYYPNDWLARLWVASAEGAQIVAHRAHQVRLGSDGLPLPYHYWDHSTSETSSSKLLFPAGFGGILYPPHTFHPRVEDVGTALQLCPTNDDIWLFWMARLNKMWASRVPGFTQLPPVIGTQGTGLNIFNSGGNNGNDQQIAKMIAAFGWPK